ncbi:MAG: hypothetical protein ACK5PJ_04110 [Ralstonia sp.]|uniref:Uncharacterized protein n=1 Tax=Ralstonia pickettii (strain 12D) TaxID=428406 RepID=C6BGJ6_RALP1
MGFVYANPSLFSGRVEERSFIDVSKIPHLMRQARNVVGFIFGRAEDAY